jgi:phosphoribosyl-AMP cyclohydrolase
LAKNRRSDAGHRAARRFREVLMLGYMNQEALAKTEESGKVTFYSRTKQRLWTKGKRQAFPQRGEHHPGLR